MKKLLLFTVILSAHSLFAQLHISPSATDNFMYVSDVVLYVEDDIDLKRNTTAVTEASLYLRNNAQLFQGGTTNTNSGDGQLSVWQFGTEDNFGYDNWSSPVGNNTGNTGTGALPFGINAFYDAQLVSGFPHPTHSLMQVYTTSLNGERDPALRISRRWIHVLRGQGNYADWLFVGHSNGIEPGDGFTMKGTIGTDLGDPQLYDFRGRPNNGTISRPVSGDGAWVYVGNPYPSHIDLAKFLDHNTDVDATAYFYEKSDAVPSHYLTEIQSGYGTWVPNGGANDVIVPYADGNPDRGLFVAATFQMYYGNGDPIPCSCGTGNSYEARFAQIGQGFMVEGNTLGAVEFTNDMRLYIPSGYLNDFKSAPFQDNINDEDLPVEEPEDVNAMLRFYVEINDTYRRDMVLGFSPNTTKGKDRGWDGKHPALVSKGDTYWALENETDPYVIQNRPFDINDVIPLGVKTGSGSTEFKVKLVEKVNFNERLYLFDKLNNTYQPIRLEDPSSDVSGQSATILMNQATNINDRFYIVFKVGNSSGEVIKSASNVDFFQNNRASQLEVFNPDLLDVENVSVYDMSGKLVINESDLGTQSHLTFGTSRLSDGVYLVKLTTTDHVVLDYKITIHNKY